MVDEDAERRKARKKVRWSKGTPGKPRKIVDAGPAHGACTAGVYYAVHDDEEASAQIIVCVHSAERSFVSIGGTGAAFPVENLTQRGEDFRAQAIQEARAKGLLREN